jgi:hypothetical protein
MRWPIADTADRLGTDWVQELYLLENLWRRAGLPSGRELRQAHGRYRKQKQPAFSEAPPLARWWDTITDKAYVEPSTFQFAQAWVAAERAAKRSGQLNPPLLREVNWMSTPSLARFFDNFHMPLLPPEVDEGFLIKSLRCSRPISKQRAIGTEEGELWPFARVTKTPGDLRGWDPF